MEKSVQEMMEVNVIHGKDEGIIEMKRLNVIRRLAGLLLFLAVFCTAAITSFAAEGKVIPKTANIRAQASADSEVVASTTQGKTIDIQGAVKDASGTIWYQVPISGGGHGYIRSDLVQTSDNIKVSESAPASSGSSSSGSPAETVPTAIGETQAAIKSSKSVRVRTGASTQHSAVASLPNGTGITLIGEANDNSGKKWYQITCTYEGKAVEGYVRSDLVEVGAAGSSEGGETPPEGGEGGENPEGETPEGEGGENPEGEGGEPEPEPEPEHNDYEVVYAQNDTGEYEYYLYNNVEGNRQKLNELLSAVGVANENNQKLQKQVDNSKIIIIVLAVVIVLLFIAVTVLIFKVRSLSYDYEYEEEDEEEDEEEEEEAEEEEEEEEETPVRKRRRKAEEEDEEQDEAPVRRRRASAEAQERSAKSGDRPARSRTKGARELYAAEQSEPARKPASRKPQNFLIDDDEFEFEFLNMDDKDL